MNRQIKRYPPRVIFTVSRHSAYLFFIISLILVLFSADFSLSAEKESNLLLAIPPILAANLSAPPPEEIRPDSARKINIPVNGSLQNPAWSYDANLILFTVFNKGYNIEPADLYIYNLEDYSVKKLVSDGSGNINLPGSVWNKTSQSIIFSSSREPHDEIFMISENGNPGDEIKITNRINEVAYEPSFSPDGKNIVFESHKVDVEVNGVITKYKTDGTGSYQKLTDSNSDCRQPNWSPAGDLILYQKLDSGRWDIWVMDQNGENHRKITSGEGDKTDGSFSPDGKYIVYSADGSDLESANIFMIKVTGGIPVRVTNYSGYDGAPSISPDGKTIIFESSTYEDPDLSKGTSLYIIDTPQIF